MTKIELMMEELAISRKISCPAVSERTVQGYASKMNRILRSQEAGWHVVRDGNVLERVSDDGLSENQKKAFAEDLIDMLSEHGVWYGVDIYDGHRRYMHPDFKKPDGYIYQTRNGSEYTMTAYGGCPCEYGNPDTLTLTFDCAGLYDLMNYGNGSELLDEVAKKYHMYNEQGYAWSTAFYHV